MSNVLRTRDAEYLVKRLKVHGQMKQPSAVARHHRMHIIVEGVKPVDKPPHPLVVGMKYMCAIQTHVYSVLVAVEDVAAHSLATLYHETYEPYFVSWFNRAIYLPRMSNSMLTTLPVLMSWKLVFSKV